MSITLSITIRRLFAFCVTALAAAAPQGHMHLPSDQEFNQHSIDALSQGYTYAYSRQPETANTIAEIPDLTDSELTSILEQSINLTPQLRATVEEPAPKTHTTYGSEQKEPHQEALVTKNFYIHSAPEEEDEEVHEKVLNIGQQRKNYNVVFIRAPVPSRSRAGIKIIPAVNEDKTIVYVLSKNPEADEIQTHVEEIPTTTTKPEVHFIKYKTDEEAVHAQEKIQAEYQHLGGSTELSDEGISPVSSVIGSLSTVTGIQEKPIQIAASFDAPQKHLSSEELVELPAKIAYLPPSY